MTPLTRLATAVCAGALLLGTAACGSTPEQTSTPTPIGSSDSADGARELPGFPGANGEIAAVDGSTAQVQSPQDGQVAVTWNDKTTFTRQVAATLADVEVGSCVMVGSDAESTDEAQVSASTVRISAPVDGSCAAAPGRDSGPPRGRQQELPSPPEGLEPPDGERPQVRRMGGAFGEVAAVSDAGFTVTSRRPGADATSTVTVTVTGETEYSRQAAASAADVEIGDCAVARGKADDTGAITAETIALSPKQDGGCGMAMMRGGPRAGGPDTVQDS